MAKKKIQPPIDETKAARFKRVVEPRVGKALKAIRLVGSVSGTAYEHDAGQIASISSALLDEVTKSMDRLSGKGDSTGGFSL